MPATLPKADDNTAQAAIRYGAVTGPLDVSLAAGYSVSDATPVAEVRSASRSSLQPNEWPSTCTGRPLLTSSASRTRPPVAMPLAEITIAGT